MQPLACAALLLAAATPALAQTLTDGNYRCVTGDFHLGDIALDGGRYAGPAFDGAFEGWHPFTLAGDTITWRGPLGGIGAAGTVVSTVLTHAGDGQAGFDITIQNPAGNFQTVSCFPAS